MKLWDLIRVMWEEQKVTIIADLSGFRSNRPKRETIFKGQIREIWDPGRKLQRFFDWSIWNITSRLVNVDEHHRGIKSISDEIHIVICPPAKEGCHDRG